MVTVFDQSGNSDSYAFSVSVTSAADTGSVLGRICCTILGLSDDFRRHDWFQKMADRYRRSVVAG